MRYNPHDPFFARAKREGFAARSVYKLDEIQRKHQILRRGDRVLDLGCAPGSWLQFAAEAVGPGGRVVGLDRSPVRAKLPPNVEARLEDVTAPTGIPDSPFDVVLSDLAPATTGARVTDEARSIELCRRALEVAASRLVSGGRFVAKALEGESFPAFVAKVRALFREVHLLRPRATRRGSTEIFVIGLGFRSQGDGGAGGIGAQTGATLAPGGVRGAAPPDDRLTGEHRAPRRKESHA